LRHDESSPGQRAERLFFGSYFLVAMEVRDNSGSVFHLDTATVENYCAGLLACCRRCRCGCCPVQPASLHSRVLEGPCACCLRCAGCGTVLTMPYTGVRTLREHGPVHVCVRTLYGVPGTNGWSDRPWPVRRRLLPPFTACDDEVRRRRVSSSCLKRRWLLARGPPSR
jgi:hypothetical protein